MTPGDRLAHWARELERAGVPSPQHDARALVAHVLGIGPGEVFLASRISPEDDRTITELVHRRAQREPLQHITGSVDFLGLELEVGPGVFVPRPETEFLADHLVGLLGPDPAAGSGSGLRLVDLCCGSGALGLALAANLSGVMGVGVEISESAAAYARRNTAACSASLAERGSGFSVIDADAAAVADRQLAKWRGLVDAVVCNPPYVPDAAVPRDPEVRDHDPGLALYGGPDGLAVVRKLLGTVASLLRPGGLLAMEHADSQGEDAGVSGVPELLRGYRHGPGAGLPVFTRVVDHHDLTGRPRFTTAIRGT